MSDDAEMLTPEAFRVEFINPEQLYGYLKSTQTLAGTAADKADEIIGDFFPLSGTRLGSKLFDSESTLATVTPASADSIELNVESKLVISKHEASQPSKGYFSDEEVTKIIDYLKEKGIRTVNRNREVTQSLDVFLGNGVAIALDLGYKSPEDDARRTRFLTEGKNPQMRAAAYRGVARQADRDFANSAITLALYKDGGQDRLTYFPVENQQQTADGLRAYARGYQTIMEGVYRAKNIPLPDKPIILTPPRPSVRPIGLN